MQIKLFLNSASELKNVNWRYGNLQPYAIAWIDSSAKCSTKVDVNNGDNPVWNEKFTIQLPPTSHPETAILFIEIVHAKPAADIKALVGSVKLPIKMAFNEVRSTGKALFSLVLERPSGRPQGSLEIQIEMKDINIIQNASYGQPAQNMPPQPQPVNQYQPQPVQQFQPQAQYRPVQQMNLYRNMAVRPGYPANAPQNLRPTLAQQPGNAMLMQPGRLPYRPAVNQQASSLGLGNALCSLAFGVNPMQIKRMVGSINSIQAAAFHRAQAANTGMLNNNGFLGNSGNDPSAAQGYDGSYTMDGSDNVGYDNGTGVDGQFGFGDGGFGVGGLDMGGLDMGGFDLGSGLDLGGLDLSGLSM